jgi:hypothetical protein
MRSDILQSFSDPGTVVQLWRREKSVIAAPIALLIEHAPTP